MVAKSGHELLQPKTLDFLEKNLFPHVSLLTPNIFEAEKLLKEKILNTDQQEAAAKKMAELFGVSVLLKGGHLQSETASDVLYLFAEKKYEWFHAERIETRNTHGTGCTLSAAIAAHLAKNDSLTEAVSRAKQYLTQALLSAKPLLFGKGCGPVNHGVPVVPMYF